MEADTAEHLHPVGQRAPEDHRQEHCQPGVRPVGRAEADRPDRGAVAEAHEQTQQTAHVPQPEAGECLGGTEVPRVRRDKDRQHR